MTWTVRVSTPGNNCLTDTNRDHYALYADEDNILIKEKSRGTINVTSAVPGTITHSLGYIPYVLAFAKFGGTQAFVTGKDLSSTYPNYQQIGTANVIFRTSAAGTVTFSYYIFYDQIQ